MVKSIPTAPRNSHNGTQLSQQHLSKKTFGNQNTLPRLPVPDLFDTCQKLIEWVAPLVGENELKQTMQAVDEFQRPGGDGEKLQKELIKWSQKNDIENWLEPFWDEMYLRSRLPVAINKNFSIVCQENPPHLSQTERATSLIHSALTFKKLIDNEELVADQERGRPVCMMQFRKLFSSTRIPKKDIDQLRTPISKSNPTSNFEKHIVVFCKGQIFVLDVLTDAGDIRESQDIERDLNTILTMVQDCETPHEAIGILTTMNRDEWANARQVMLNIHPHNQIVLDAIERSLFALCLDDTRPESLEDIFRTILHGDGRNRWFDKSFQIIVCQDGKFGLSGEHSGLDGYSIHSLISFIYKIGGNMDYEEGVPTKSRPVNLEIHSNRELKKNS
jgi:carnitine O-acetyltransferase